MRLKPGKSVPHRNVASFGFNTCHAPIAMRSDIQFQFKKARKELQHRYWRCHGMLSDDVGILPPNGSPGGPYCFSGLGRILDAGLQAGLKPFFELSFMPSSLARDPQKTITHYRGITSPPKDFSDWENLVHATVSWLADRYGKQELRQWYFEVWNEPNIPFWDGTQAEYFELYRRAAIAIKRVDPKLRVGGPATARGAWVADLLKFTKETRTPIDFISTHIYPSDVAFSDFAEGEVELMGLDYLEGHFKRVEAEVQAAYPGMPIIWGEWNSSAGPLATNHDSANNAALVAGALALMSLYSHGSLYWGLSDIYEECQYHFAPFHGGYGLYTVDHVAKSAARAHQLFNALLPRRIEVEGEPASRARGILATTNAQGSKLSVLLWNHDENLSFDKRGYPVPRSESAGSEAEWKPVLNWGDRRARKAVLTRILPGRGSAYETWLKLGSPLNLAARQLEQLHKASLPEVKNLPVTGTLKKPNRGLSLSLPPGSAALLQVTL